MGFLKNNKLALTIAIVFAVAFNFNNSFAETVSYKINGNSKMWLEGTSTLHNFKCDVKQIVGKIKTSSELFSPTPQSSLVEANITIPVKKIVNDDEDLTENMHEAFNEEKFPQIKFKLTSNDLSSVNPKSIKAKVNGELTISGVTKLVSFDVIFKDNSGSIAVTGNTVVKMTDYGIKPPTMFLGTIKAGNEVKVFFELSLNKE